MSDTQNTTERTMTKQAASLLKLACSQDRLGMVRIDADTLRTSNSCHNAWRHVEIVRDWSPAVLAELIRGGYVVAKRLGKNVGGVDATDKGREALNDWAWRLSN